MKRMLYAAAALACVLTTSAAWAQEQQPQPAVSAVGCWMLSAPNSKLAVIPPMTKVRLDSVPSPFMQTHFAVERLSHAPPEITTEELSDWFVNPGDGHIILKLGDAATNMTFDLVLQPNGNRMDGRLGSGPLRADRMKCKEPKK